MCSIINIGWGYAAMICSFGGCWGLWYFSYQDLQGLNETVCNELSEYSLDSNWVFKDDEVHLVQFYDNAVRCAFKEDYLLGTFLFILLHLPSLNLICALYGPSTGSILIAGCGWAITFIRAISWLYTIFSFHYVGEDATKLLKNSVQFLVFLISTGAIGFGIKIFQSGGYTVKEFVENKIETKKRFTFAQVYCEWL